MQDKEVIITLQKQLNYKFNVIFKKKYLTKKNKKCQY